MKKFWRKPVTWGEYLTICAAVLTVWCGIYCYYSDIWEGFFQTIKETTEKIVGKFKK